MPMRRGWGRGGKLITGGQQIISLSAEFGEDEETTPSMFTVQLDVLQGGFIPQLPPSPPLQSNTACFAYATVIWTVNGVTMTRVIDVAAGVSISGLAESVRVLIRDETSVPTYPGNVEYGVIANISVFTRPRTAVPPIRTGARNVHVAAGFAIPDVVVPAGANSVAVYGTDAAGAAVAAKVDLLAFWNAVDSVKLLTAAPILGTFIPLVGGTQKIRVTNLSATAADISVVFGIDG